MPQPFEAEPGDFGDTDWRAIATRLQAVARALTRNADEAADLTQQTFATLLARAPQKCGHYGYARQTLVRLWLDDRRSWRRSLRRLALAAVERSSHGVDSSILEQEEQVQALRAAIERLPARQRAALVLRLVEGQSYVRIAEILDCSVEAARANLHAARQRLRGGYREERS